MIPEFVIQHFAYKKGISFSESLKRHKELELFLRRASRINGLVPNANEDETWHNFILHTKLYSKFCKDNYGYFIHHNPQIPLGRKEGKCKSADEEDEEVKCDCGQKPMALVLAKCSSDDSDGSCKSNCDTSFS